MKPRRRRRLPSFENSLQRRSRLPELVTPMAETVDPIDELYPYLSGKAGRPKELDPALAESVRQKAADSVAVKERFFAAETAKLIGAAHALAGVFRGGRRLFAM